MAWKYRWCAGQCCSRDWAGEALRYAGPLSDSVAIANLARVLSVTDILCRPDMYDIYLLGACRYHGVQQESVLWQFHQAPPVDNQESSQLRPMVDKLENNLHHVGEQFCAHPHISIHRIYETKSE